MDIIKEAVVIMGKPLIFHKEIAAQKPENYRNEGAYCPFCDREALTNIFREEDDKIWLMNKYRTLDDTVQTLVIESQEHWADTPTYSKEENRQIFRFTFDCWLDMLREDHFESVLLFKNYGPRSGGSLRHPHSQIVGLKDKDGYEEISLDAFKGLEVGKKGDVTVTLSTQPIMGMTEFNVSIADLNQLDDFADAVQSIVTYILTDDFSSRSGSYNLFFYPLGGRYYCKVFPRFIASPYFIGFKIGQVSYQGHLEKVVAELQDYLPF